MEILEEGEFQALIHKLCAVHQKETLGPRCAGTDAGRRLVKYGEMGGFRKALCCSDMLVKWLL
jgi:hypothetical protein